MNVIFMGSPECACPSLEALEGLPFVHLAAVVTQPDRPAGRGLKPTPCPVRQRAEHLGRPVFTPPNVNDPAIVAQLASLRPDVIVVAAFGQMLKRAILEMASHGCINVHASLLPKYRGAAPAQWAIVHGERVTGVTLMRLNERMDAGDILLQREVPIAEEDTGESLLARLGVVGAELLMEGLEAMRHGPLVGRPQDDREATYAPRITKADGAIVWSMPAEAIVRRVRAFYPWPGCWCEAPRGSGRILRVLKARAEPGYGYPGIVLAADGDPGPLVAAGEGAVRILEGQPAGRRAMTGGDLVRGRFVRPGDCLG
jgi:methionyl-tRNA formyltransferase